MHGVHLIGTLLGPVIAALAWRKSFWSTGRPGDPPMCRHSIDGIVSTRSNSSPWGQLVREYYDLCNSWTLKTYFNFDLTITLEATNITFRLYSLPIFPPRVSTLKTSGLKLRIYPPPIGVLQPTCDSNLAHILNNQFLTIMLSQIQLKRTSKQLQQHLKARLGNSRVVPTLAELIANKSIYITIIS
jgi:hypothetical protein